MSMPRVTPDWPAEQLTDPAAGSRPDRAAQAEPPGYGDPYALPEPLAGQPPASRPPVVPGSAGPAARASQPAAAPAPAARRGRDATFAPPPPGSIADLRARLDRLPDGHPSSPYDDTGRLKAPPTRLRQLELGLPARGAGYLDRFPFAGTDDEFDGPRPGDGLGPAASRPARQADAGTPPEDPAVDDDDPGSAPLDGDEPAVNPDTSAAPSGGGLPVEGMADGAADPGAGQPGEAGRGRGESTDRPAGGGPAAPGPNGHGGTAARHEWQHPYAQPGEQGNGSGVGRPGGLALAPWPASDPPAPAQRHNGHRRGASPPTAGPRTPEVADLPRPHERRPEPARPDLRQHDPEHDLSEGQDATGPIPATFFSRPGAQDPPPAGPGPRENAAEALTPELRRLADRILAACRAAEGRDSAGEYGTSGLTPAIRRIAAQLPAGGLAPGSEAHTLKTADRFAAKLARLIARQPGRSPEDIAAGIGDAIRYAFTFSAADYAEGTWLVHRRLKAQGFDLEVRRNRWDNREYKGVLTQWRDPAHGLPFEVQFHTPESWAVASQTHDAYVQITDPATPPADRARLRARQAAATAAAKPPPGWRDIADFRAAAR